MISCDQVSNVLSLYIDNEVDMETKKQVEEHILNCASCKTEFDELQMIVGLCSSLPQEELPVRFKEDLRKRLAETKAAIKKEREKLSLRSKHLTVFTTIAAGLMLVVFLRGAYENINRKNYDLESAASVNNASIKSVTPKTGSNSKAASHTLIPDMALQAPENSSSADRVAGAAAGEAADETAAKAALDSSSGIQSGNTLAEGSAYSIMPSASQSGDNIASSEASVYELSQSPEEAARYAKDSGGYDSESIAMSFASANKSAQETGSTGIKIYTSDPEVEINRINEWIDKNISNFDTRDAYADYADLNNRMLRNGMELDIKLPKNEAIDAFLNFISAEDKEADIEVEIVAVENISEYIANISIFLKERYIDVCRQIYEIENNISPDTENDLDALKAERDRLIEEIKIEQVQYTLIHITMIKK